MKSATPKEIVYTRKAAGLTQAQAAVLMGVPLRTWQKWESGERTMSQGLLELFTFKVNVMNICDIKPEMLKKK